jgi:hypothetical protein
MAGPSLSTTAALEVPRSLGRCAIFFSAAPYAYVEGGADLALTYLCDTEGPVTPQVTAAYNDLKAEATGELLHARKFRGEGITVAFKGWVGDPAILATLSPTGSAHSGTATPTSPVQHTLLLVPAALLEKAGGGSKTITYTKADGWKIDTVAPTTEETRLLGHMLWIWGGHFTRAMETFQVEDGGPALADCEFVGMANLSMPDGHLLWTRGKPEAATPAIHVAAA